MVTATAVRKPLNRDGVVDRVVEIADHEGLDAVTIRRLAGEFQVTPMALYWHFKTKDDLLAAAVDRILGELPVPEPADATWMARFAAAFNGLVVTLSRHPQLAELAKTHMLQSPAGRDLTEYALAALADGGFDVPRAAQIAGQALLTAITLVTADAVDEGVDEPEFEESLRAKRVALAALRPEQYPHLIAASGDLVKCEETADFFSFGAQLFLAGVQALAPAAPGTTLKTGPSRHSTRH